MARIDVVLLRCTRNRSVRLNDATIGCRHARPKLLAGHPLAYWASPPHSTTRGSSSRNRTLRRTAFRGPVDAPLIRVHRIYRTGTAAGTPPWDHRLPHCSPDARPALPGAPLSHRSLRFLAGSGPGRSPVPARCRGPASRRSFAQPDSNRSRCDTTGAGTGSNPETQRQMTESAPVATALTHPCRRKTLPKKHAPCKKLSGRRLPRIPPGELTAVVRVRSFGCHHQRSTPLCTQSTPDWGFDRRPQRFIHPDGSVDDK